MLNEEIYVQKNLFDRVIIYHSKYSYVGGGGGGALPTNSNNFELFPPC